ncbi:primosomal protein N' [Clostridium polyendosporum]|uniref:primosomal protein N' n=1 Tax=Clostridium polyendosporum TaxID=69208 RepID=UPI00389965D7
MFAGIIVNNDSVQVDRPFTYLVDEGISNRVKIGHRVKVPFGKGNKLIEGFVITLSNFFQGDISKLKAVKTLCEETPILTKEDLTIIEFMRERYLCKYIEAIRVLIPTGIMKGIKIKTKSLVAFSKELDKNFNKSNFINVINIVKENDGIYTKSELNEKFNVSLYSLNKLLDNGFLKLEEQKIDRSNQKEYVEYSKKILNTEQQNAVDTILTSTATQFLLKGVTGSGKTEVYMNLVNEMLRENKTSLVLVPEISLTPQMIERFKGRFGKNVAIFHSKLSDGERFDEWYRIKHGEVKLVIGVRSAIFLPFHNLGLIIIDEEHESTYKSDQNPKYHTREIAELKSRLTGCKVVYGSATPSIESYYRALKDEIKLVSLNSRVDNAVLPKMNIIDMREELKENNKSIFSGKLHKEIQERLDRREQVIIFLNRRGYSTFVSCRKCGYVFKCEHCDISMTYHTNGYLVCHYCGSAKKQVNLCPKCGSKYVKYFGAGTEKVEVALKQSFPKARILRMDVDTTRKKNSHEEIYNKFKNGEADILVGTQMISKGLDFPNVTLVGVITADISLNLPDFRSAERTFQIVTQVAGRAGRGNKEGEVIVQTYSPEHYSLRYSSIYDYDGFFKEELNIRKIMNYPPFSKIMIINLSSQKQDLLIKFSTILGDKVKERLMNENHIDVLGPCPSIIQKINEMFRWQIIIKGEFDYNIANNIKEIVYDQLKDVYNVVRVSMDINPNTLT